MVCYYIWIIFDYYSPNITNKFILLYPTLFKRVKSLSSLINKHIKYLAQLPKIAQSIEDIHTLYNPDAFFYTLLQSIKNAKKRIYLVILFLEKDKGGYKILNALYQAKRYNPILETVVLVDWYRAQRGRIGSNSIYTNADWYYQMAQHYPDIDVPIYGVPINIHEALGVLHLKGCIIDDTIIYSGASLNNVYLHQSEKYRSDRYQIIHNPLLAEVFLNYIHRQLLIMPPVVQINSLIVNKKKNTKNKNKIRLFRQSLRYANYIFKNSANDDELAITPLVGLGKKSLLNQTIHHLICSTKKKLIICTPYFNMPMLLIRDFIALLKREKKIEVIIGDKIANDFYIPEDQPFKIIGAIPYLYEVNLRHFIIRLQQYIENDQLLIRLWKDGNNSYHLKGIWVDDEWQLLTGNNFNPRSWRLDLENALLVHDPKNLLLEQRKQELFFIRSHTKKITHFTQIQKISEYPNKIKKIIRGLRGIRIDKLIKQIL
ncbi:CDP-diacylglycerol--serine O-phosphatidyltransferase [Candidatus Schneideria nysicola]|nr:CDP-diacylglycerol--serine O-phosphatidyltransferase [Candidatus Schneideria nysicola]